MRFEPLNPVTPGHMLFVPFTHVGNASTHPSLTGLAFEAAARWARDQNREYNLITSAGPNATQSVRHLHIHYVPRAQADGLHLPWTLAAVEALIVRARTSPSASIYVGDLERALGKHDGHNPTTEAVE